MSALITAILLSLGISQNDIVNYQERPTGALVIKTSDKIIIIPPSQAEKDIIIIDDIAGGRTE